MSPAVDLTYREVGATRDAHLPPGYGHVHRDVVIGRGAAAFDRAVEGLFGWRMHRLAGLRVVSAAGTATVGAEVVLRVGLRIPCRVVYTVDEPGRRGFAYGTLPGHPEQGEEAFVVEMGADQEIRFQVTAFSRPASLLARAGGPLTRLVQRYATDRYVKAMRTLAAGAG